MTVQVANTTGATNSVNALVERNGNFWAENLPLAGGTNNLTLIATDAAGNSSVTNITVVKSNLVITINPVLDDLWQPTVNVTGTVSAANYSVWVNGVRATVNADGTWGASNVPVNEGGTASFVVTAYAPGEQQPGGSP